jgi:hypothetical protein
MFYSPDLSAKAKSLENLKVAVFPGRYELMPSVAQA